MPILSVEIRFHTVTYRHIARQRIGKHLPAGAKVRNTRTRIKQYGTIEDGVFRGVRPEAI
jgi:hypothetical protein